MEIMIDVLILTSLHIKGCILQAMELREIMMAILEF